MRWTYVGTITPGSSGVFTILFRIPVTIALNVGAATTLGGRYHYLLWVRLLLRVLVILALR